MNRTQAENTPARASQAGSERFSADEQALMRHEFAQRLRAAFDNATNAEIARRLKTSDATVKLWMDEARLPVYEILVEISRVAGVSLNWLMRGEGPKHLERVDDVFSEEEEQAITDLARRSGRTFNEEVRVLAVSAAELAAKV